MSGITTPTKQQNPAAKAAADSSSPTLIHPVTSTWSTGPVHCVMATAIACLGPERIACSVSSASLS